LGLAAFNDAILLETCIYTILAKYFRDQPYYQDLLESLLETTKLTSMGQALDLLSAHSFSKQRGAPGSLSLFDMKRYNAIVKYKTSYYSFFLPVALAMNMAGIKDPELFKQSKRILLEMGKFFQVQDDYLDCFGDPAVTGKKGTDIQDGKCSWLVVMALQRANAAQKQALEEVYGVDDPDKVAAVKKIYMELNLPKIYDKFETDFYNDIQTRIQQISAGKGLPHEVFNNILDRIYKRKK
jgi:farnesyl diphosphate synthase